ncbi:hypothetical protein SALBM311S_07561 [Streptomyces alboniger]
MTATTITTGTRPAARVVDAVKVYGGGDISVRALDGVSVGFPAGRFTAIIGALGLRQVHPHALRGRSRHPHLGRRPHR